ncbi:MAG: cysteine--tRNA ligase [Candidatus Dojkabacteria bacterium]|nr:cysteine--tRNA ligase [Candidatus Dojkabacteria bacterium]
MRFYNTLTRKVEAFTPSRKGVVSMYNCGPTVYWNMQLGNLRAYTFVDVLRRSLEYMGLAVEQVMNFTDVGHLSDDGDEGEDKMEKTARKTGQTVWDIAQHYIDSVKSDFREMNFLTPVRWARATDHIDDMISLVKKIEENGFTYETDQALYFDISKMPDYTRLQGGQSLDEKRVGVREELNIDPDKRNPADFALWIKAVGKHAKQTMRWESPWGVGFPGWHIECSAMGTKYLGETIDIHTGGEDHISVHHPNERAQNYGAFQKEVVRFWLHNMFLMVDGGRMGKSEGNAYELSDVKDKGFEPMDLRYFFLTAHYRTKQNFTWDNLQSARNARLKLIAAVRKLYGSAEGRTGRVSASYRQSFISALENDLMLPEVMALVWKLLRDDEVTVEDRLATVLDFDRVLGLRLKGQTEVSPSIDGKLEKKVEQMIGLRDDARKHGDWDKADKIRSELREMGIEIEDLPEGTVWRTKSR